MCSVLLEKRWVLSALKPRYHVDTASGITWTAMANFDENFACRSLLGLPANSTEELMYYNKKICWTRWRILIKILPVFHVEIIRKAYCVSIYILLSQNPFVNKKGNTTAPELTALPYIFDYY